MLIFEFHSHVRLRFKFAAGLGQPWTRDGGPLSIMFIVALCLPWCRYLAAQVGVQPNLNADNLKCVSRDPEVNLGAARFTTGYVRLVGQAPAPGKCVLMSTSRAVRSDMRGWVVSDEGHSVVLSSWMFGILGVILILLFMVGPLPWLLGYVLSFLGWFLFLLFRWIFMGGSGFFVPCLFLVLCMVLRLLFLLALACGS